MLPITGPRHGTTCWVTPSSGTPIQCKLLFPLPPLAQLTHLVFSYDFGDFTPGTLETGEPYMQLLAQTNATEAKTEALEIRGRTLAGKAPEIPPAELLALIKPKDTPPADDDNGKGHTAINASDFDLSKLEWDDLKRYALIAIGLLAANVVIGLILLVIGVFGCIRGRGKSVDSAGKPHYVPVTSLPKEADNHNTYYSGGRYDTPAYRD